MTRTAKLKKIVKVVKELNGNKKLHREDKAIIAGYILSGKV